MNGSLINGNVFSDYREISLLTAIIQYLPLKPTGTVIPVRQTKNLCRSSAYRKY